MSGNPIELIKVVLVGDVEVGKTSLMQKWVTEEFPSSYTPTVGVDFRIKKIAEQPIKLQIWDLAGRETFNIRTFYKDAQVAVIVFDVTNRDSFSNVGKYLEKIKTLFSNPVVVLVGNKTDLVDKCMVSEKEAKAFAQNNAMIYIETSAKDGLNVLKLEHFVLEAMAQKISPQQIPIASPLVESVKKLQTSYTKNENMQWIGDFLLRLLSAAPQKIDPSYLVKRNQAELEKNLNALWWTGKSFFNSVVNLIITVFLTVSVVGMPIAYLTGLLEKNKQESGHSCMFFKFGEYQMAKANSNQVFAEVGVEFRI